MATAAAVPVRVHGGGGARIALPRARALTRLCALVLSFFFFAVLGRRAEKGRRRRRAGIEDFHFGKDIDKTTSLVIDGRALAPSADYLGKFNVSKTDVGSFEMGYKSFRTYYDGVGGFFPLNNNWQPLANQDLHVDRGQFWVEGKIALPNKPVFTVRYSNETRTGNKDSTIWGSSDSPGIAAAASAPICVEDIAWTCVVDR